MAPLAVVVLLLLISNAVTGIALATSRAQLRTVGKEHTLKVFEKEDWNTFNWRCTCGMYGRADTEQRAINSFKDHAKARQSLLEVESSLVKELETTKKELEEQKEKCICKDL